jgi:hypothetical protein
MEVLDADLKGFFGTDFMWLYVLKDRAKNLLLGFSLLLRIDERLSAGTGRIW